MDTVSDTARLYTANKIMDLVLNASRKQRADFSRMIGDSLDSDLVNAAIADFKRENPLEDTFSRYHKDHDAQYFLRQTLIKFTAGDARKIIRALRDKKDVPMAYATSVLHVAERLNDPMHRPLMHIAKIDALPFLMPEPKPPLIVAFTKVTMGATRRGAVLISRATLIPAAIRASAPYRKIRHDYWGSRLRSWISL
jgi:hypothetical protein